MSPTTKKPAPTAAERRERAEHLAARHAARAAELTAINPVTVTPDVAAAERVGELLRANGTSDLADAHVALLVQPQDRVLTSDEDDIKALLRTRRVKAVTVRV